MSDTRFTASNGWYVEGNDLKHPNGSFWCYSHGDSALALGEYYAQSLLADRDAELGRWRSVENPDCVVYHTPNEINIRTGTRYCRVMLERGGTSYGIYEKQAHWSGKVSEVAREFFAAHPLPEPKPWEQAKHGEAWLLTVDGLPSVAFRDSLGWQGVNWRLKVGSLFITAGRRIWPGSSNF